MSRIYAFLMMLSAWLCAAAEGRIALPVEKVGLSYEYLHSELWDASRAQTVESYGKGFVSLSGSGLMKESLGEFTELYRCKGDSVVWRGYTRGRGTGFLSDSMVVCRPLADSCCFSGLVKSYDITLHELSGRCSTALVGTGRFVFSPGDTVAATLYSEQREYVFTADNAATDTTTVDFYRWYAVDAALPFAVQVRRAAGEATLYVPAENVIESASLSCIWWKTTA